MLLLDIHLLLYVYVYNANNFILCPPPLTPLLHRDAAVRHLFTAVSIKIPKCPDHMVVGFTFIYTISVYYQSRFKILYSHKPMHYNGTEIDTKIQYQYLHAHDKMMDVTQ